MSNSSVPRLYAQSTASEHAFNNRIGQDEEETVPRNGSTARVEAAVQTGGPGFLAANQIARGGNQYLGNTRIGANAAPIESAGTNLFMANHIGPSRRNNRGRGGSQYIGNMHIDKPDSNRS